MDGYLRKLTAIVVLIKFNALLKYIACKYTDTISKYLEWLRPCNIKIGPN